MATEGCTERPPAPGVLPSSGPKGHPASSDSPCAWAGEPRGAGVTGAPFTSLSSRPGPVSSGGPSATLRLSEKGCFYKIRLSLQCSLLFTIDSIWKQPKFPLIEKQIKIRYIHTVEYYSPLKRAKQCH